MAEINDLFDTDASNVARFPELQAPSTVNNGARALEGLISRWHNTINGSVATGGVADTYTWACPQTLSAYYDGLIICVDIHATSTGASTINVDSLGAKDIKKHNDQAVAAGDLEAGGKYLMVYDGTNFQLISSLGNNALFNVVEDTTPQLGGDLDLNGNNIDFPTTANISDCLDEDNMASDSATVLATQQSIKAYADSLVVSQANQAAIEAETNENTYIPPDLVKHSPGVGKIWAYVDRSAGTPSLSSPSYNVTSVADLGAGRSTVTIDTDFSTAVFAPGATGIAQNHNASVYSMAAGSFAVHVVNTTSADADTTDFTCWAFGDQA